MVRSAAAAPPSGAAHRKSALTLSHCDLRVSRVWESRHEGVELLHIFKDCREISRSAQQT